MPKGGSLKKVFSTLFLFSVLFATPERGPWFTPLWEFTARAEYDFFKNKEIVSPENTFSHNRVDNILGLSLQFTPWLYWNLEGEIDFKPSYLVSYATGRYMWFEESFAPLNLTTGVTVFFPSKHILHDPSFLFVGRFNGELFAEVGKELGCTRLWSFVGFGKADEGRPWTHLIAAGSVDLNCQGFELGLEYLKAFGGHNIETITPFPGYAEIDYTRVNMWGRYCYYFESFGTLKFEGKYNIYARNSSRRNFDLILTLAIPFSL